MSEIRYSPPSSAHTLAGGPFSKQANLSLKPALSNHPTSPCIQSGSVEQLFGSSQMRATPNAFHAAPLVDLQSHTASRITNPSSTPAESDGDWDSWRTFKSATTGNAVIKGLTRATSRLGSGARGVGSVTGLVGAALSLPGGISEAAAAIQRACQSGEWSDITQASASTTSAGSTGSRLIKHSLESTALGSKFVAGRLARRAGTQAFRQAAPGASKAVIAAAAKQAGIEALKESTTRVARKGVTAAAQAAAKGTGTLARGAGVAGRAAAKQVLREGGEAAAKAAGKAVAKGALKAGGKAVGRFVPGLNVAIAGFDTATAAATLADPKASTGKKVTSVITAAGSIVAATNIPIVSQVGAAVSTVSSFIGSFF